MILDVDGKRYSFRPVSQEIHNGYQSWFKLASEGKNKNRPVAAHSLPVFCLRKGVKFYTGGCQYKVISI